MQKDQKTPDKETFEHTKPPLLFLNGFANVFEKLINRALKYDPATHRALEKLSGKTLCVACTKPQATILFSFDNSYVNVRNIAGADEDTPKYDVVLTGEGKAFAKLAQKKSFHSLADSDVNVSGNISVLSQIQEIAKHIDIDWEDALAQLTHPVVAHAGAGIIRTVGERLTQKRSFIQTHLPSILADELQIVPLQEELDIFYHEVDSLAERTTRLEAKIHAALNSV